MSHDVVVVGSGAGGAVTALGLARAGARVLVLEEGPWVEPGSVPPLSLAQLRAQYRFMGQGIAWGVPPMAYAEGRCVGGSTEVNSGLYHRTPAAVLEEWRRVPGWESATPQSWDPVFAQIERDLDVATDPRGLSGAGARLVEGARSLGWRAAEVPRWHDHVSGVRRSMLRSYLPRASELGVEIRSGVAVRRVVVERGRVVGLDVEVQGERETVAAACVVLCAGAVGTAALLQRSRLGRGVGRLAVHPWAKVVARFDEPVSARDDVPSAQISEFSPDLNLGCGASTPAMLGLALMRTREGLRGVADDASRLAIYYAAVRTPTRGRVRAVPGQTDPVVAYQLSPSDADLLRSGLRRLMLAALRGGARSVVIAGEGAQQVSTEREIGDAVDALPARALDLMTVHLMSTVPATGRHSDPFDEHGACRAVRGLWVNDASVLPGPTGVNPQGSIMAVAWRNVARILEVAL
jgi:choline dehydrogenase-like flavoprotein